MAVFEITIEVEDEVTALDLRKLLDESDITVLQLSQWKKGDQA